MHDHECRGRLALVAVLRIFHSAIEWLLQPATVKGSRRAPGKKPGLLKLQNNVGHQRCHGGATGFDNEVCCFAVKRVTHRIQTAQSPQRIVDLQQRPVYVVAQAAKNLVRRRVQIDNLPSVAQPLAVKWP